MVKRPTRIKNSVQSISVEKNQNVPISYDVWSKGLVIWVGYNKENDWDPYRVELLLTCLIKNVKLDKIGYKEILATLKYKLPYREPHELTVEYYIPSSKFDFEVFFYDIIIRNMIFPFTNIFLI